ncbi:MAG: SDR family NAD(P)-dependent oxidoreductase [Acidimicrobiia bacterium]
MSFDLQGKVAIVTGASRGVGAAVAEELGRRGATVVCAARATDAAPLPIPGTIDDTARRITDAGGRALAVPTNLARDEDMEHLVTATITEFGGVDVLVNNAAITFPGDMDLPIKRFDLIMDVDVRAPYLLTQLCAPHIAQRGGGRICNVSSVAALNDLPGLMVYGMAKIAMERMTVTAARQYRSDRIAVNTFRIDVPVASEGFVYNLPDIDHSDWEPSDVAAGGIVWMITQPDDYTGRNEGMQALRQREGIMESKAERVHRQSEAMIVESPIQLHPWM